MLDKTMHAEMALQEQLAIGCAVQQSAGCLRYWRGALPSFFPHTKAGNAVDGAPRLHEYPSTSTAAPVAVVW